jgi:nitrite reductase (NADH) small subunit
VAVTCLHHDRSLAKCTLLNGLAACPGYQWKFDSLSGEPEDQDGRLATYAVQVTEEGAVLVDPVPVTPREATTSESATHPAGR